MHHPTAQSSSGESLAQAPRKVSIKQLLLLAILSGSVCLPVKTAWAEGSRDLFPSGGQGNRGHIEWRSDFSAGFLRRTLFQVFAEQGEYILVGSSATGLNRGNIEIFHPGMVSGPIANETLPTTASLSCTTAQPGRGFIANRSQEIAGPVSIDGTSNTAGYQPCFYQAPVTGIYTVAMYGPSGRNGTANPNNGIEHSIESINATTSQNTGISAWDVTVRNTQHSAIDIPGRLHTFNAAINMGQNGAYLYADLYPITLDGFRYEISLRGVDPNGFSLFGNQLGNLDSNGTTSLYRDVLGTNGPIDDPAGGTKSASPQYPIFFNEIDPAVLPYMPIYDPFSGLQTGSGFPATPLLPEVTAATFSGNIVGDTSSVGGGGQFSFTSNLPSGNYQIIISRDGVDFDPYGPNNKQIRGYMSAAGQQIIDWDGLDNSGEAFPVGAFKYLVSIYGGEYHFPMSDVENNVNGGPTYRLLNAANPFGNTVAFYDHRGYTTADGFVVRDRNPGDGDPTDDALCGTNPPNPPASDLIVGADSSSPSFNAFGQLTDGNTNVQCTGAFGDTKTLDIWTYFPSEQPAGTVIIINPADFGDAPDSAAGNGPGNYQTRLSNNGPLHSLETERVYLGDGVTNDQAVFGDGIDDSGNATDDVDDAFRSLPAVPASGTYRLNDIPVHNETNRNAILHAWIDFDQNGAFAENEYQSAVVAPGDNSQNLSWTVPTTSAGITYARFRLTTYPLTDDANTTTVDERSIGGAGDGEVEDYAVGLTANTANILLTKRITAINNNPLQNPNDATPLNTFVNDGIPGSADDHPYWPSNYLTGATNGGLIRPSNNRPSDTVEYTLYFLSTGAIAAKDVMLCDRIPANTTFVPDTFNTLLTSPVTGGGSRGLFLSFNNEEHALTNAHDGDEITITATDTVSGTAPHDGIGGYYFPPGEEPSLTFPGISCASPNTTGAVVIDISTLPNATEAGRPQNAYGFVRFQVSVN